VSASLKRLRHGTRLAFEDGRLVRVEDRDGAEQVALAWDGDVLVGLEVPGPRATLVRGERVAHLLFGEAQPIVVSPAAEPATWVGAIDWARPVQIPPIEHPARLPAGAGTTILNTIAWLAELAGVEHLRYAGPYPTSALWASLMQSFRVDGAGDEAAFTADALARAARADMTPVRIDFAPAPFERLVVGEGIVVQLRDGVDRILVGGEAYVPGAGVRRLVPDEAGGWAAEVWLGGAPYARVATVDASGARRDGPHPVPPPDSPVVGQVLPPALLDALAGLIADLLPAPLAARAPEVLATLHVGWGDAGAAAARDRGADRGVIVHAALWDRLAPRGLAAVALALAEALAPAVAVRAQARLAALLTAV
jgi:hypothetical protein